MTQDQIRSKLPLALSGPKVMPDTEARKAVRIEVNCVCGQVLEPCVYLDEGLVKILVHPCKCGSRLEVLE